MGSQSIARQRMAFARETQVLLADLEEGLNFPASAVKPDDLVFRQGHICGDQNQPVFAAAAVVNKDEPDGKTRLIHTLGEFCCNRQKPANASAP